MQPNQQVTFLTDGGEDVRDLPLYLNPQAEHCPDWFHVPMRITLMTQLAKGLRLRENPRLATEAIEELERLEWFLWHGNVFRACKWSRIVSKRMVKKQQMRWTPEGAHLLLQVRTRALNRELATTFRAWYPAFAWDDVDGERWHPAGLGRVGIGDPRIPAAQQVGAVVQGVAGGHLPHGEVERRRRRAGALPIDDADDRAVVDQEVQGIPA